MGNNFDGPLNNSAITSDLVINDGNIRQPMDNTPSVPSLTLPPTKKQKKNQ